MTPDMSDVERLLRAYIEDHRATGSADPRAYLSRVEGVDRRELETLIDGYLARAPRRPFDPAALAGSRAAEVADELVRSIAGEAATWPELLPALRNRARLRRAELVARLAAALGLPGREEKVGRYYHEMERGLLPPTGVADRVLEALGALLGEPAETLREAGRATASGAASEGPAAGAPAFARTARPAPEYGGEPAAAEAGAPPDRGEPWDEVDELFRGGGG